jgi:hypothetical protein
MIKEMTTLESRERRGGKGKRGGACPLLRPAREPELLATSRASFLEKKIARVAMSSAGEFYWRNTPFVVLDLSQRA